MIIRKKLCHCLGLGPLNWYFVIIGLLNFGISMSTFSFVVPCTEQMQEMRLLNETCSAMEELFIDQNAMQGCSFSILQIFLAILPWLDSFLGVKLTKSFWTAYAVLVWALTFVNLFALQQQELDAIHVDIRPYYYGIAGSFVAFAVCWCMHPRDDDEAEYSEIGSLVV
jgi:hypothetical protein